MNMSPFLVGPSKPPCDPPSFPLPPLPTPKTRRAVPGVSSSVSRKPSASLLPSKLVIRPPSRSTVPQISPPRSHHTSSTPMVPTLRSISTAISKEATSTDRSVRRSVSIANFPQPPKGVKRSGVSSGRPSLIGTPASPPPETLRRVSVDSSCHSISTSNSRKRKLKSSNDGQEQPHSSVGTPSLLNGTGDGKCISFDPNNRSSDGLLSLPSPLHSRSSSAQGSSTTSATTFEDVECASARARESWSKAARESQRNSKSKEGKGNVIVSVRVRPDPAGIRESAPDGEWIINGKKSLISFKGREGGDYCYDNVFVAQDQNDMVYDSSAKPLVRRVMEGYHGTVFAYGMTGTGKTFSMQGTKESPGIIPMAITDIFSYIRETPHREFLLRVSYLEIYNEKIYDLLSPNSNGAVGPGLPPQEEIKLREDSKHGVYAYPLKEEIVQSPTQLMRVIARGDAARRTGSTQFNSHSSRSHAVVQIVVESRERATIDSSGEENKRAPIVPGGVRVSTLSLIDLAGSEKAAESRDRRAEGSHINKSLLTLGTVIARLSGEKDKTGTSTDKHLPYRDSKLTRLLQPALSGNSLISILCTIQASSLGSSVATYNSHTGETLNTLKFAARAKNNIVSHAKRSEEAVSGGSDANSRALLDRYRQEIQDLRGQLKSQAKFQAEAQEKLLEQEVENRREEQILEIQLARTALTERIKYLSHLILCSKSTGVTGLGSPSPSNIHPTFASFYRNSKDSSSPLSPRTPFLSTTLRRTLSGGPTTTITTTNVNRILSLPHHPRHSDPVPRGAYDSTMPSQNYHPFLDYTELKDEHIKLNDEHERLGQAHDRPRVESQGQSEARANLFLENIDLQQTIREKNELIVQLQTQIVQANSLADATRRDSRREVASLKSQLSDAQTKAATERDLQSAEIALLKRQLHTQQKDLNRLTPQETSALLLQVDIPGEGAATSSHSPSTTDFAPVPAALRPRQRLNTAVVGGASSSSYPSSMSHSPMDIILYPVPRGGMADSEGISRLQTTINGMLEEKVRERKRRSVRDGSEEGEIVEVEMEEDEDEEERRIGGDVVMVQ